MNSVGRPGRAAIYDPLVADMNPKVDPGVDFFEYANGGWIKRHPIPASESSWGIASQIQLELYGRLRKINEDSAKKPGPLGSPEQQIGDYWATAMDERRAEHAGLGPLKPLLDRIDAVTDTQSAIDVSVSLHRYGLSTLFGFGVGQDDKDSDVMAVDFGQGGLGLPDRDYYFGTEPGTVKVRDEYLKYIQAILELGGQPDAASAAKDVMAMETALAKASRKMEDLRDPEHNYNKMTVEEFESKLTPSIHWDRYLAGWGLHPGYVLVGQPEFFTGLESILKGASVGTLKSYLRFHVVAHYAEFLNKKAVDVDHHFSDEVLEGEKALKPRWKRVLDSEDGPVGFILGRIFVKDYFPAAEKQRYSDLVEAVRKSFSDRIDKLDWMSAETKAKAHEKLAAVRKKVGYPDKWKDYSKLVIARTSYCENVMSIASWSFDDMLSKFGKPVDRDEWDITPQTFNAYYDPSNNEIVLPAASFAIPGVKDADLDDAVIYGNMAGSWIGHEMTHGFDDQGRQYDAHGNLANWWTPDDAANFEKRAQVMVDEFNAFEPLPGLHVNGKASLGENIADYGGILIGLDAFKKTDQFKEGKKIDGLTPLQRYFLGYTLSWLSESRDEALRRQILSDVHAPAKYRVNGPLSNIPDFYDAFGIKAGQPMWRPPDQRVHIW